MFLCCDIPAWDRGRATMSGSLIELSKFKCYNLAGLTFVSFALHSYSALFRKKNIFYFNCKGLRVSPKQKSHPGKISSIFPWHCFMYPPHSIYFFKCCLLVRCFTSAVILDDNLMLQTYWELDGNEWLWKVASGLLNCPKFGGFFLLED